MVDNIEGVRVGGMVDNIEGFTCRHTSTSGVGLMEVSSSSVCCMLVIDTSYIM